METTVSFIYKHLAAEYNVTASFTREDAPRLAMHSETGAEGEWVMQDISVEDEDGECWYMAMRGWHTRGHSLSSLDVSYKSLAEIILEKALEEIE